MSTPYKTTPLFDEITLPEAIRTEHRTKPGTWGLLRVIEGAATLVFPGTGREVAVTPDRPGEIPPGETHYVRLSGPVRLQVEFHRQPPLGEGGPA